MEDMRHQEDNKRPNGVPPEGRKRAFRFAARDDVYLLREVVSENPFETPGLWGKVAESLNKQGMPIDGRRCRERTQLLLAYFVNNDRASLRRSGTEEEHDEKEQLLQEIKDLRDESRLARIYRSHCVDKDTRVSIKQEPVELSLLSASPMLSDDSDESYSKGNNCKTDVMEYLVKKHEDEFQIKKEELELRRKELELRREELEQQKRKLQLEEERFVLEKHEKQLLYDVLRKRLLE